MFISPAITNCSVTDLIWNLEFWICEPKVSFREFVGFNVLIFVWALHFKIFCDLHVKQILLCCPSVNNNSHVANFRGSNPRTRSIIHAKFWH
jgi:hypothetical protein